MKKYFLGCLLLFVGLIARAQLITYTTVWVDSTSSLSITDAAGVQYAQILTHPKGVTWDSFNQNFILPKGETVLNLTVEVPRSFVTIWFAWTSSSEGSNSSIEVMAKSIFGESVKVPEHPVDMKGRVGTRVYFGGNRDVDTYTVLGTFYGDIGKQSRLRFNIFVPPLNYLPTRMK